MRVAHDSQADAPDHRLVPLDQGREGQLGHLVRVGGESFQELAVGQVPDGPDVVKGPELTKESPVPSSDDHDVGPSAAKPSRSRRSGIGRFIIMSRGARMVLDPREISGRSHHFPPVGPFHPGRAGPTAPAPGLAGRGPGEPPGGSGRTGRGLEPRIDSDQHGSRTPARAVDRGRARRVGDGPGQRSILPGPRDLRRERPIPAFGSPEEQEPGSDHRPARPPAGQGLETRFDHRPARCDHRPATCGMSPRIRRMR